MIDSNRTELDSQTPASSTRAPIAATKPARSPLERVLWIGAYVGIFVVISLLLLGGYFVLVRWAQ